MTIEQVEEEGVQVSMIPGSSTAVPVSSKAPVFSDIAFRNIEIKGANMRRGSLWVTGEPGEGQT